MKKILFITLMTAVTLTASDELSIKRNALIAQLNLLNRLGLTFVEKDQDDAVDALVWNTLTEEMQTIQRELIQTEANLKEKTKDLLWQATAPSYELPLTKLRAIKEQVRLMHERIARVMKQHDTQNSHITTRYHHTSVEAEQPTVPASPTTTVATLKQADTGFSIKQLRALCFGLVACLGMRYLAS